MTSTAGGAVQRVNAADALEAPAAVAVDMRGTAYVVDAAPASHTASLYRLDDGRATLLAAHIGIGFPAGVALTRDGSKALVSGVDPRTGRDVVYVVAATSGEVSTISKPFERFTEAAGLHRAHDADVFAWADSEADGSGTVYVLQM